MVHLQGPDRLACSSVLPTVPPASGPGRIAWGSSLLLSVWLEPVLRPATVHSVLTMSRAIRCWACGTQYRLLWILSSPSSSPCPSGQFRGIHPPCQMQCDITPLLRLAGYTTCFLTWYFSDVGFSLQSERHVNTHGTTPGQQKVEDDILPLCPLGKYLWEHFIGFLRVVHGDDQLNNLIQCWLSPFPSFPEITSRIFYLFIHFCLRLCLQKNLG